MRWFCERDRLLPVSRKVKGRQNYQVSVIEKPVQSISHSNLFLVTGEVVNVRVCTVNEGHDLIGSTM